MNKPKPKMALLGSIIVIAVVSGVVANWVVNKKQKQIETKTEIVIQRDVSDEEKDAEDTTPEIDPEEIELN